MYVHVPERGRGMFRPRWPRTIGVPGQRIYTYGLFRVKFVRPWPSTFSIYFTIYIQVNDYYYSETIVQQIVNNFDHSLREISSLEKYFSISSAHIRTRVFTSPYYSRSCELYWVTFARGPRGNCEKLSPRGSAIDAQVDPGLSGQSTKCWAPKKLLNFGDKFCVFIISSKWWKKWFLSDVKTKKCWCLRIFEARHFDQESKYTYRQILSYMGISSPRSVSISSGTPGVINIVSDVVCSRSFYAMPRSRFVRNEIRKSEGRRKSARLNEAQGLRDEPRRSHREANSDLEK